MSITKIVETPASMVDVDAPTKEHIRVAYFASINKKYICVRVAMIIERNLWNQISHTQADIEVAVDQATEETIFRKGGTAHMSPDHLVNYIAWLASCRVKDLWRARGDVITFDDRYTQPVEHDDGLAPDYETDKGSPYFWCLYCPSDAGTCQPYHENRKRLIEFLHWMRWDMTDREKDVIDGLLEGKKQYEIADELGSTEDAVKSRWARIRRREYRENFELAQKIFGYTGKGRQI